MSVQRRRFVRLPAQLGRRRVARTAQRAQVPSLRTPRDIVFRVAVVPDGGDEVGVDVSAIVQHGVGPRWTMRSVLRDRAA